MKHIFKRIAEEKLDSRFAINSGGCGIFAVLIYCFYKQYYDGLKIVYYGDYSHVMLSHNGEFYDSEGVVVKNPYWKLFEVSFSELAADISNLKIWNSWFDRKNIPTIVTILAYIYVTIPVDKTTAPKNKTLQRLARVYGAKQTTVPTDDVFDRLAEIQRLLVTDTRQARLSNHRDVPLRTQGPQPSHAFRILGGIISKIFRR